MAEYEAPELKETMTEAATGRRIFEADEYGKVMLRFPNNWERSMADLEFGKKMTELMVDTNLKTQDEMEKILRERGIWGEKQEAHVKGIRSKIEDATERIIKSKSADERKTHIEAYNSLRNELTSYLSKRDAFINNTIEARAEEARQGYLLYCVATNPDTKQKIWKSYEAFMNEERSIGFSKIIYEWMTFSNGLPSNFLEQSLWDGVPLAENGESDGELPSEPEPPPSEEPPPSGT